MKGGSFVLGSLFRVLVLGSWLLKPGDGGEHTRPRGYRPVPPPGAIAKAIFHHGYVCYSTASCFEGFIWLPAPGGTPGWTGRMPVRLTYKHHTPDLTI